MDEKQPFGLLPVERERLKNVFANHPGVDEAIIYGSRAKGTHRAGSDVDIALRGDLDWQELQLIETNLDNLDLPYQIDLSLESQIESQQLLDHIKRVGKPLYKRPKP